MTFVITCEISCDGDGCGDIYDGGIMQADSTWKADTLRDAKSEGWSARIVDGEMKHFCPDCSTIWN